MRRIKKLTKKQEAAFMKAFMKLSQDPRFDALEKACEESMRIRAEDLALRVY